MTITPTPYAVADAIAHVRCQLGAYRAIEQLTTNEYIGSEESLAQLNRSDMATLLCVVNTAIERATDEAAKLASAVSQGGRHD